MRFNFVGLILVLFACAVMFSFGCGQAKASAHPDRSSVEKTKPADAATAPAVVDFAIFEETRICNVADRVTATVARNFQPVDVRIPEAPSFEIGHVPVT